MLSEETQGGFAGDFEGPLVSVPEDMEMKMGQGWFHAEVGIDQFVQDVGAFLDILILASGYQSNGSPAVWTPGTLQKALDWACYLEEVLDSLPVGTRGDDSKNMLDLKLDMMLKNKPLPPGMTRISSAELEKARSLLVHVLVRSLPGENAWLTANIVETLGDVELKEVVIREISQRCMATGCVKSLQMASELAAQFGSVRRQGDSRGVNIWQTPQPSPGLKFDEFEECIDGGLMYITSAETIRKLSAATLIFSAGRTQWLPVFESLLSRPDSGLTCVRVEIAELCCFFLASSRWKSLPRKIAHLACKFSPNSVSFENCFSGKEPTSSCGRGESFICESHEVETYLRHFLSLEKELLLQLHPVLLAVALAESSLLEDYARYIVDSMLDRPSECSGKCACNICRRRKDARERSWWLLMLLRRAGVDNPAANDGSGDCRWSMGPPSWRHSVQPTNVDRLDREGG